MRVERGRFLSVALDSGRRRKGIRPPVVGWGSDGSAQTEEAIQLARDHEVDHPGEVDHFQEIYC